MLVHHSYFSPSLFLEGDLCSPASFELPMYLKMVWDFQSSSFYPPSAEITGLNRHTRFAVLEMEPGLSHMPSRH